MTINEMKQKILLCVATLQRLNGTLPDLRELCSALGSEYEGLIRQFLQENRLAAAPCM